MRRLRQFLHKKRNKDASSKTTTDTEEEESKSIIPSRLDLLPSISISLSPETWKPTSQTCAFFSLPSEIRLQILHEAFGGRTIHIDLRHSVALYTFQTSGGQAPVHGGYPPDSFFLLPRDYPPHLRRGREMSWKWYSCVCHRGTGPLWPKPAIFTEPHLDVCLQGAGACEFWPGVAPGKCYVGAMGFLLSCKQSHDELLGVLYPTNTFYIDSKLLVNRLFQRGLLPEVPRLIGPGMDLVTSIEMKWDLTLFDTPHGPPVDGHRRRFQQYLDQMPVAFPNLGNLYIFFKDNLYIAILDPRRNLTEIEDVFLKPLLAARVQATRLEELCISVAFDVFDALESHLPWRGEDTWERRVKRWYPPTTTTQGGGSSRDGFWIKEGISGDVGWRADGSRFRHSHVGLVLV